MLRPTGTGEVQEGGPGAGPGAWASPSILHAGRRVGAGAGSTAAGTP